MHNFNWKQQTIQQSLLQVLSQYLWLKIFSLFSPLQFIHLYDNNQNLSKPSGTWIGGESWYQLLQTTHNRTWQLCHNNPFTEYNVAFMCYHQINSCSILVRLLHLVNGQICKYCLIYPLYSLDNPFSIFAWQICLGYEPEVNLIQVCDLKKAIILLKENLVTSILSHQ